MKKILYILSFILIFMPNTAKTQTYKHGLGGQLNIGIFKETYTDNNGLHNPVGYAPITGILYKASLGFEINRSMTFSVSSYPFLGFYLNSQTGGYLGAELPLLGEFFFGDIDYFGAFIGAGGSISYSSFGGFGNGVIIGPQIEGGIQFPFNTRVIAVKLAYTYGLNNPSKKIFPDRIYSKSDRGLFSIGMTYIFEY